jgi:hypothetical protein
MLFFPSKTHYRSYRYSFCLDRFAAAKSRQVDECGEFNDVRPAPTDKFNTRAGRSASRDHIVYKRYPLPFIHCV